uniref:Apple domain-containing protein n=1 Tax=Fagus sylvatica TaxID=28930 RepID=A0A2N9HPG2_FAGSY
MYGLMNSLTRLRATQLLLLTISILDTGNIAEATTESLFQGFKATPKPSVSSFQPLLNDSTGNFSLGFLRVDKTQLALAVLHVPSSQPLWLANPTQLATWSDSTQLFFNGSLVISDSHSRVFWSTQTNGDIVVLLNSSNLQIQNLHNSPSILWQSFDVPSDTLVENQSFTVNMSLISTNGLYSMRLGYNFIGLYAKFQENSAQPDQIYLKHTALEAQAQIVEGQGPIYALVNSDGYLGLYQNGTKPIDVQAFNSFQRPINGFLRVRLEPDGNLIAYYWDGSSWVLDFKAISDTCELPSPCGSYGLCTPGQQSCSCLDNRTEFRFGTECLPVGTGDFCGEQVVKDNNWAFTRKGVEVPFKELMYYETTSSFGECEGLCENNCSCWGAVYNNGSGFCFLMDYPIQTLVSVGDESKVGYFKVREGGGKKKTSVVAAIGFVAAGGAIMILIGIGGFWTYRIWRRKTWDKNDEISPGPYKNLGSESSKSIEVEMCNR